MHTRMTSWHRNGFHINSLVPSRFLLQGHGHAITVLRMMMTSSHGNIFRVTGHLCGEFTGDRWIPRTKTSDAKLWYFLWSAPWINVCGWWFKTPMCSLWRHCNDCSMAGQTTVQLPAIWNAMALMWCHGSGTPFGFGIRHTSGFVSWITSRSGVNFVLFFINELRPLLLTKFS